MSGQHPVELVCRAPRGLTIVARAQLVVLVLPCKAASRHLDRATDSQLLLAHCAAQWAATVADFSSGVRHMASCAWRWPWLDSVHSGVKRQSFTARALLTSVPYICPTPACFVPDGVATSPFFGSAWQSSAVLVS